MKEIRSLTVVENVTNSSGALPADEYGFMEFYCDDAKCDCRRAFIQVLSRSRQGKVLASINVGWERLEFYRRRMPYMPEAAQEIVSGSLDPINEQSELAPALLEVFRNTVATADYRARLKSHYELFRRTKPRRR